MLSDFHFFHDCNTKAEAFYTDDVLSLLKSSNHVDVEKDNNMIKVRIDNDFYLQCYVMEYLFCIPIRYLAYQSGNEHIYSDSIIYPNQITESIVL